MPAAMSLIAIILFVVVPVALLASIVKAPRTGVNRSRAGLMELQNLLEPERRVEVLRQIENKEGLLVRLDDEGGT